MNQQMSEETGRECTTEEDQQNMEAQNILPSIRCCLMSSDVGCILIQNPILGSDHGLIQTLQAWNTPQQK